MNWSSIKCFFNQHDWDWNKEDIDWISGVGTKVAMNTHVKICQNCHKKQRYGNGQGWVDWDILSKEEIRDKKLKQLGI
jgi:hypothetical protein